MQTLIMTLNTIHAGSYTETSCPVWTKGRCSISLRTAGRFDRWAVNHV